MAESNDTIDPNDLDSIDALLDEAELETVKDDPSDQPEGLASFEEGNLDDLPKEEAPEPEVTAEPAAAAGGIMDNFPAPEEPKSEPQPEPEPVLKPLIEDDSVSEQVQLNPNNEPPPVIPMTEEGAESFLQKRGALQQQNQNQNTLTVAEMDSIKKLIIIFSSITITLVLVAIGIGVWSALGSNSGLDEEARSLLEDIHSGSTQGMIKSASSEKTVKQLEKKLDALSFQIEQLNQDIAEMDDDDDVQPQAAMPSAKELSSQGKKDDAVVVSPVSQPVSSLKKVPEPLMQVGLIKKLDKVNSRMVVTQRQVSEINNRVKSLQTQYKSILRSVKKLEQGVLEEQVKMSEEQKKAQALEQAKRAKLKQQEMERAKAYEYSAPTSPYFDSY